MDFVSFIVPEFGKAKEVSYLQHPTKHVVKKKKGHILSIRNRIYTEYQLFFPLFQKLLIEPTLMPKKQ